MTNPTMPHFKSEIIIQCPDWKDGPMIAKSEAIAWHDAAVKQARIEERQRILKLCEQLEDGLNTAVMIAPKEHKDMLRAKADELRKLQGMLKEGV